MYRVTEKNLSFGGTPWNYMDIMELMQRQA